MPSFDTSPNASYNSPKDFYWALDKPDNLVKHLTHRRDGFYNLMDSTNFYNRVDRNWSYYHGIYYIDGSGGQSLEVKRAGKGGDKSMLAVNHMRSVMNLLISYVTQNRPAWDTRAINADNKSLQQAEIGNDYLDYQMEDKNIEDNLRLCAEQALILTTGYVKVSWDADVGEEISLDEGGQIVREGDIKIDNLSLFDVIYDQSVTTWADVKWVLCKTLKNKWDLIAKYPDKEEDIKKLGDEQQAEELQKFNQIDSSSDDQDLVHVWEFYHLPTPSLPLGKYLKFVGNKTPLEDGEMPYKKIPVHRLVPDEYILSTRGYSPGFDLQGIQEVINAAYSTIVTNFNKLGPTKIWFKAGETINEAELEPGVKVLQSETEPKPLNLLASPQELYKIIELLRQEQEYLSGVNSVARGQAEPSLRSHAALALIDAKVMQYASTFIYNYYQLLSGVGTSILQISKKYMKTPRMFSVIGKGNRSKIRSFDGESMKSIDRVVVDSANPLQRTLSGRWEMGMALMQSNKVTGEEFMTLQKTGQIKPLTESIDAQLSVIHEENELLREGAGMPALWTDNHALHIEKHQSVLDTVEARLDERISGPALAHIADHLQQMFNPADQFQGMYQIVMGYQAPLPPGAPQGGDVGGAPQAPAQSPQANAKQPSAPAGIGAAG